MKLKMNYFSFAILLIVLRISTQQEIEWNVDNNWKKVDIGWPIVDKEYDNSQFYFVKENKTFVQFRFSDDYIKSLKSSKQNTFKISFKYWSFKYGRLDVGAYVDFGYGIDVVSNRHKSVDGHWLYSEYILSYDQLSDFKMVISLGDGNVFVAFKDFRVEYETITNQKVYSFHSYEDEIEEEILAFNDSTTTDCIHDLSKGFKPCFKVDGISGTEAKKIDNYTIAFDLKDLDKTEYCFNVKYTAIVNSTFQILFSSLYDLKNQDVLLSIKPRISQAEETQLKQTSEFCLRDLVAVQWGDVRISFKIIQNSPIFGLEIDLKKGERLEVLTEDRYLNTTTHSQWLSTRKISEYTERENENDIVVKANAERKFPTSVHIFSKWIKYDNALEKSKLRYTLTVKDIDAFNSFTLRAKLCDDLSHCKDFYTTKLEDKTENQLVRSYYGNFYPINAKYVKLLFYIEYFQQGDIKIENDIAIKLDHFGHPCDSDETICNGRGECYFDNTAKANQVTCDCDTGYTGDNCEKVNYCQTENPQISLSGNKFCESDKGQCKNLDDGFRCTCVKEGKVIGAWNKTNMKCESITPSMKRNWQDVGAYYFPSGQINELNVKLDELNNDDNICIEFTYNASKPVILTVNSFKYYLSHEDTNAEVCSGHFVYNHGKTLTFVISSNLIGKDNFQIVKDGFTITKVKKSNEPIKTTIKWQKNDWTDPEKLMYGYLINRKDYITVEYTKDGEYQSAVIKTPRQIPKEETLILTFMTDWINYDSNLPKNKNEFYLKIVDNSGENLELNAKILHWNNYVASAPFTLKVDKESKDIQRLPIAIPTTINSPFKLVLEVSMSGFKDNDTSNYEIILTGLKIGDSCYVNNQEYCPNHITCTALSPSKAKCQCDNNSYGDKCDKKKQCVEEKVTECKKQLALYSQEEACIEQGSTYSCNCMNGYSNWQNKICSRSFSYKPKLDVCEGTCNMLSDMKSNMEFSVKNLPEVSKDSGQLPFYYSTTKSEKLGVTFKNLNQVTDYCLNVKYKVGKSVSLFIGYNNNSPIELLSFDKSDKPLPNEQTICVSDLTRIIDKDNSKIYIYSENLNNDVVAIHLEKAAEQPNKFADPHEWFVSWADKDFKEEEIRKQWKVEIPYGNWDVNNGELHFNNLKSREGMQDSLLMSNWIKNYKTGMKLRFKLINESDFTLKPVLFDLKMKPIIIDKSNVKTTQEKVGNSTLQHFEIAIPVQNSGFRLGLLVTYKGGNDEKIFSISDLDFADACVEEMIAMNSDKMCSGDYSEKCERLAPVDGYKCHCIPKHKGDDCEITDWCNETWVDFGGLTGNDFCADKKSGKCAINNKTHAFLCDCSNDETGSSYFDPQLKQCFVVPKCLTKKCDYTTQYCRENSTETHPDADALCVCKDGFVDLSNDQTKPNCQKYEPCNDVHRKLKGLEERPCKNDTCHSVGNDVLCSCAPGSYPTYSQFNEGANCQPDDKCGVFVNPCEQYCYDGDCSCSSLYEKKGQKCSLTKGSQCEIGKDSSAFCDNSGALACKNGFKPNENKTCVPDESKLDNILQNMPDICPGGKAIIKDGKIECDCPNGYKFDISKNKCAIIPICSENSVGRKACDEQNALCLINAKNLGKYECQCPEYTSSYRVDENVTKCFKYCDIPNRNEKCELVNAHCKSTIAPKEHETVNDYCECLPGYYFENGICSVKANVNWFKLQLRLPHAINSPSITTEKIIPVLTEGTEQNVIDYHSILDEFLAEMENTKKANEKIINKLNLNDYDKILEKNAHLSFASSIIKLVLKHDYNSLRISSCDKKELFDECLFTINLELDKSISDFAEQLSSHCNKVPHNDDVCFIKITETHGYSADSEISIFDDTQTDINDKILINKKDLKSLAKFDLINPCQQTTYCDKGRYSYCSQIKGSSSYTCACNTKEFVSTHWEKIGDVEVNTCEVKDKDELCKAKCSPNNWSKFNESGICLLKTPSLKDNKYTIEEECICKKDYKTKGQIGNDLECAHVCYDQTCNGNGECKPNHDTANGWSCACHSGWNGEDCKDEHSLGKGGWIAGIVVLAVVVVVLAGVAFMFARRSRAGSNTEYGAHQMDDMAYRVPQPRGPQTNPAFHRD